VKLASPALGQILSFPVWFRLRRVPEGALYHDPNAYLKSERSKDVVALV
jgi:hypothetical protein